MRIGRFVPITAVLLLLYSTSCLAQGAKVSIKPAWAPGAYIMTQTDSGQDEQTLGNQVSKSTSASSAVWEINVSQPNDKGEKKISAKVLKYRFNEEGEAPAAYDSEAPAAKQDKDIAFVFGALIGAPVEIVLDADDAVVEVSGLDKIWQGLTPKATTDAQKGRLAQVSIEFADKAIEQSFRRIESIAPKKDVAVGEKWTAGIRTDFPLIGEVKQRFDCALKAVEDSPGGKLAVIQLEGRYESTRPKPGQIQGQEITVASLNVTEKGDVKFDLASGIAVLDEKTLTVSSTILATDEKGQPIKLGVKATTQIKTTIVPSGKTNLSLNQKAAPPPVEEIGGVLRGPGPPPAANQTAAPATYSVFRCIDQGGIRDQATGEWLEAFHLLIPKGWQFQGGLRWVAREKRPDQLTKTDALMPVKSDYAVVSPDGQYMFRSYPAEYLVDTSRTASTAAGAGFKTGANYNGMIVWPVLSPQQYISQFVYPRQRAQAANLKPVKEEPLPRLAELYAAESARFNQAVSGSGAQGNLSFQAGSVTIDYDEGQAAYRETFITIIQYIDTAGMIMFWPRSNFSYRAPREQFERWGPVFATIATSVQANPRWSLHLMQITQKSAISQREMDNYVHKIQREIADSHAATTHELARDMGYLTSPYYSYKGTDGNRYYLPTDKYHFMNANGELLSQRSWDPPSSEWKSIEPYNQ